MAAREGMIAMITANSGRSAKAVAPFGGAQGAAGHQPDLLCDSVEPGRTTFFRHGHVGGGSGKINVATARGEQVPNGWLIDNDGKPSNDPRVLRQGGALLPLGGAEGYKGYGLATIVEIFSGLLTGLGFGVEPTGRHNDGCFIAVFNVAAFRDLETFKREVTEFAQYLKATPPARGVQGGALSRRNRVPARAGPAEERHSGRGRNLEQAARPGAGLRDRGRVGTIGKLTHGRNDTCQWIARHGPAPTTVRECCL